MIPLSLHGLPAHRIFVLKKLTQVVATFVDNSGGAFSPLQLIGANYLSYGDFGTEVDVLDRVQELDAFAHWALESFAAGNQAGAAGALVDDRRGDGFFEVVGTRGAAAVDQTGAAHEAVGNLIAAKVDGVIAGEVGVNALVEFSVAGIANVEGRIAAVILRHFLLDDIRLYGDTKMIGLSGKVGRDVVILVLLKGAVAEIAP